MKLWLKPCKADAMAPRYKLDESAKATFDKRMRAIKSPYWLSRDPRGWSDGSWKAVEFKNFTLYFFPAVMVDLLPADYYDHFMLFVSAMRTLSSEHLEETGIVEAESDLSKFVSSIPSLYGYNPMDFCVHSLLHLGFYARQFGSLPVYSNFNFEGILKVLKNNLHGTTKFQEQFVALLSIIKYTSKKEDSIMYMRPQTKRLLQALQRANGNHHLGDTFFAKDTLTVQELTNMKSSIPDVSPNDTIVAFNKFSPSEEPLFRVNTIKRATRYRADSTWVFTDKNKWGRIAKIVRLQQTPKDRRVVIGIHPVSATPVAHIPLDFYVQVQRVHTNIIQWVPFSSVRATAIRINVGDENYLSLNCRTSY
jgi:hypothetical protein